MFEIIGRLALSVVDIFVKNAKDKEELARKVMAQVAKWDREAIQSAELRDMFKRIEQQAKENP